MVPEVLGFRGFPSFGEKGSLFVQAFRAVATFRFVGHAGPRRASVHV